MIDTFDQKTLCTPKQVATWPRPESIRSSTSIERPFFVASFCKGTQAKRSLHC